MPHWSEGLPEEMASHGDVKGSENLETFVKRYIDGRSAMSRSIMMPNVESGDDEKNKFYDRLESVDGVVRVPSSPDDAEGWKKTYAKLGVPAESSAYGLSDPDVAAKLHKLNLNGGQATQISEMMESLSKRKAQDFEELSQAGLNEYKDSMGAEKFEHAAKAATKVLRDFGGDGLMDLLEKSGLVNNAELIKFGSALSRTMSDKKLTRGENETVTYGSNKEELESKIAAIRANPQDPFYHKNHPDHARRVDTVTKYYEELHPQK
jgi:hypothetical protein